MVGPHFNETVNMMKKITFRFNAVSAKNFEGFINQALKPGGEFTVNGNQLTASYLVSNNDQIHVIDTIARLEYAEDYGVTHTGTYIVGVAS